MIYTHAAAAVLALAAGATLGWQVQGWRLNGQIASLHDAQQQAVADATREARATESRRYQEVYHAQQDAARRAQDARRDADRARGELERLRDAIHASPAGDHPGAAAPAAVRAAAIGGLLDACASAHLDLARAADGHVNDVRTLIQAWPK